MKQKMKAVVTPGIDWGSSTRQKVPAAVAPRSREASRVWRSMFCIAE